MRSYSTTCLLTPVYSLGFCAAVVLGVQLVSGFFLASCYVPSADSAFWSVDSLMRDTDSGVVLRSFHANGASFFMAMVYLHMLRCLLHASASSRPAVWLIGVVIYVLLCGACFTGYSLVYGQMSLWAIVVICSMVTAIPVLGNQILTVLWGGTVVSTATVNRFFCLHFILPIVLGVMVVLHLLQLHAVNSTGELGLVLSRGDRVNLMPLLLVRDGFIGGLLMVVYGWVVFMDMDRFGHPDNYVPANALVTPALIAPEWYLLPFYGLVRAIPHKALGIVCMVLMLVSLANIGNANLRWWSGVIVSPLGRAMVLVFLVDVIVGSELCLVVNHAESVYWVLLSGVIGMLCGELNSGVAGASGGRITNR